MSDTITVAVQIDVQLAPLVRRWKRTWGPVARGMRKWLFTRLTEEYENYLILDNEGPYPDTLTLEKLCTLYGIPPEEPTADVLRDWIGRRKYMGFESPMTEQRLKVLEKEEANERAARASTPDL